MRLVIQRTSHFCWETGIDVICVYDHLECVAACICECIAETNTEEGVVPTWPISEMMHSNKQHEIRMVVCLLGLAKEQECSRTVCLGWDLLICNCMGYFVIRVLAICV